MAQSKAAGLVIGIVMLLILGCSNEPSPAGDRQQATRTIMEGSRIKSYNSVAELTADSQAVVVISATSARSVEKIGQVPFTVTQARVSRNLHGSMPDTLIKIRQPGDPGGSVRGAVPVLTPGATYVAFLKRFSFGPGRDTDQYVVVGGGAGLYLDEGGTLHRLDHEATNLPATLLLTELVARVSGA